jgi:hypothetical protein
MTRVTRFPSIGVYGDAPDSSRLFGAVPDTMSRMREAGIRVAVLWFRGACVN